MKKARSNVLTIDVEDWFHLLDVPAVPPEREWHQIESRVVANTRILLNVLEEYDATATFFVLGWIGLYFPELVGEIERKGHEIATHGYGHLPLTELSPQSLYRDIERSLKVLSPLCSQPICGYRAPGFSLTPQTMWALDVLLELGLVYDSSAFPARHNCARVSPTFSYEVTPKGKQIMEFPATPVKVGNINLYLSGGGYFRLFPYSLISASVRLNQRKAKPALVYIHPRDIDSSPPFLPMSLFRRFTTYVNAGNPFEKLSRLLSDFSFVSIAQSLSQEHIRSDRSMK